MDLAQTWWIVPISLLSSCLLSFLWLILIRLLAGVMVRFRSIIPIFSRPPQVWLSLLAASLSLAAATSCCGLTLSVLHSSRDPNTRRNFLQVNWSTSQTSGQDSR